MSKNVTAEIFSMQRRHSRPKDPLSLLANCEVATRRIKKGQKPKEVRPLCKVSIVKVILQLQA